MTEGSVAGRSVLDHLVAVLALDGVHTMELGMPGQLFITSALQYKVEVCALRVGPVTTSGGFAVHADHGLDALERAETVIVPGVVRYGDESPAEVVAALRAAHHRGARIASICTGAFTLAGAGLLDGRRATTHWRLTDELARRYPAVEVDQDVLYVDTGDVLTSAGVAAGIDLCLHLIRRDQGTAVANQVARLVVAAPYRDGGQAQYVSCPVPDERGLAFTGTLEWARANLAQPLTVRQLAEHAGMSERTLARRFVAELGTTPLRWLTTARIDLAREILERQDCGVDELADRVGMGTAANLRVHFRRLVGTTPSAYRRTFGGRPDWTALGSLEARIPVR
jgi:transcriptional regulator GlxA family with amidase domain